MATSIETARRRLADLVTAYATTRPAEVGPTAKDIAEQRDVLAVEMGRHATAAGADIREPAALALLLDVLVGITTGVLRHDSEYWHIERRDHPDAPWTATRCLAGWIVHVAHRHAEPLVEAVGTNERHAHAVRLHPDGPPISYNEAAADLLAVPVVEVPCLRARGPRRVHHPVTALFSATTELRDVWELAERYTGGAVTLPADLAPLVPARRQDVAW